MNFKLVRAAVAIGVIALLSILVLQLAFSIRQESITWDEDDHILCLPQIRDALRPATTGLLKTVAGCTPAQCNREA